MNLNEDNKVSLYVVRYIELGGRAAADTIIINKHDQEEEAWKELELKYGCNPNQKPSRIYMEQGELPMTVLNGKPGYINFLDALNGWQLVSELQARHGPARGDVVQACQPGGRGGGPAAE